MTIIMRILYNINKRWHAFLQKYKFSFQLQRIRKLFFFLIIVWLFGSLLTVASQWLFAREAHASPLDYLQYFWVVIIELVSGFDIPESIPLHLASHIISIFMLIMGLVVVGLFTGQIITIFVSVLQRAEYLPEKPERFRFEKPIVICGINSRLNNIIENLRRNSLSRDREIVVVHPEAAQLKKRDAATCTDTWFVSGDPANKSILMNALGRKDCRVIILSGDEQKHVAASSANAINTALAIEATDEAVHTVVEIGDNKNMVHFGRTKVNDWIRVSEFSLKLISQAALQPGVAKVFSQLLGDNQEEDDVQACIWFSQIPLAPIFVGKSFLEAEKICAKSTPACDITLIGFAKHLPEEMKKRYELTLRNSNYFIQLNPPRHVTRLKKRSNSDRRLFFGRDTILGENDKLIYLGARPIDFKQILSGKSKHEVAK